MKNSVEIADRKSQLVKRNLDILSLCKQEARELTPEEEKKFLDETARLFLSYFNANDFQELVNVSKQLETVSDDDKVFDKWAEGFLSNTLTGIEEAHASSYNYDMYLKISYYDRLLVASNFNGKFSASYNGKWKKER